MKASLLNTVVARLALAQITADSDGLYVSVVPSRETVKTLRWMNKLLEKAGLTSRSPVADWHITVVYSKVPPVDLPSLYDKAKLDAATIYLADTRAVEYWDGHKDQGVIVLTFDSPQLSRHNKILQDLGYTATFPEYTAHMTLASDIHPEITKEKALELVAELNKKLKPTTDLTFTGIRVEDIN